MGGAAPPAESELVSAAQTGQATPVPPLQLALGPADELASTPTRVAAGPPRIVLTDRAEDVVSKKQWLGQPSIKLSLSAANRICAPSSERRRVDNEARFTWDDLLAKVHDSEASVTKSDRQSVDGVGANARDSTGTPYYADINGDTKDHVFRAAANAAVGLESSFVFWSETRMRLCLAQQALDSKFCDYLALFARCGSYLHRLRRTAESIRNLVGFTDTSRTALALATAIDSEVGQLVRLPRLDSSAGLVTLYSRCFRVNSLALTLAELIGCADLEEGGRLSRVPPATTILERAYSRAILQQSQSWHGPMLWRLVSVVMSSWLDELSFVVGLTEQLLIRKTSRALQQEYFPELFFMIDEDASSVSLDSSRIPRFVPRDIAQAALRCYEMLVVLGMNGPDAVALARTGLRPLSIRGSLHRQESQQLTLGQRPSSVQSGVRAVFSGLDEPLPTYEPHSRTRGLGPASIESDISRALAPIVLRHNELNQAAKLALQRDFESACNAVSQVYLLADGCVWSLLQDLADAAYADWRQAPACLPLMNEIVREKYPGVSFVLDPAVPRSLRPSYPLPVAVERALSTRCLQSFESAFSRLVNLHHERQNVQFALLSTDAAVAARKIENSLSDASCGFHEVVRAFEEAAQMMESA